MEIGWMSPKSKVRSPKCPAQNASRVTAFTLLEVMIACGIFFIAVFAILALVSQTLRNARSLRHVEVDAGMGAAYSMRTNLLYEGTEDLELDAYPEYRWELIYTPVESNGLWQVDIALFRRGAGKPIDTMSILRFSPESKVESAPSGIHPFP